MKNLAREEVLSMEELSWGKVNDFNLRLQFGENPKVFPPSIRYIQEELFNINFYPDPEKTKLRELLAKNHEMSFDDFFIGNGSDGLIELICKVFVSNGDEVLIPSPTFPAYIAGIELMGGLVKYCNLKEDFSLNFEKLKSLITNRTKLIFIANPNNPTGNLLITKKQVEELLDSFQGILVIDEAYFEFSGYTVIDLVKKYDNLVVLRTFSKAYGLAGLRIGYSISSPVINKLFKKSEGSSQVFAVNRLALKAAESVLENQKFAQEFVKNFIKTKNKYEAQLKSTRNIKIIETKTSFCIFSSPLKSHDFKNKINDLGISIKSMSIFNNVPDNLIYSAIPEEDKHDLVIKKINIVVNNGK